MAKAQDLAIRKVDGAAVGFAREGLRLLAWPSASNCGRLSDA